MAGGFVKFWTVSQKRSFLIHYHSELLVLLKAYTFKTVQNYGLSPGVPTNLGMKTAELFQTATGPHDADITIRLQAHRPDPGYLQGGTWGNKDL